MESYLVRVYRKVENDPNILVGVVREIGTEEKKAFHTFDELRSILNSKNGDSNRTKRKDLQSCNNGVYCKLLT
ncbi:MAG TPA: hypothetical protein VLK23_04905 [Thermodesulfobacteriota bacterium]|nr:hypothetical protein [Thermodesulfobacteriota bacterium]